MKYRVNFQFLARQPALILVGCGGTGSCLAAGLCRLLIDYPEIELLLVDMDRVEDHNILRQNFFPGDVGKFKSQVLAERLSRQYGRRIAYSVLPFDKDLMRQSNIMSGYGEAIRGLVIGCVDSVQSRRAIAEAASNWRSGWLDSGNGFNSGQVLFGNAATIDEMTGSFNGREGTVNRLPLPSLQQPTLLVPPSEPKTLLDCAEAVAAEEQSAVINQAMATLVLEMLRRLLKGDLTYFAQYIDLDAGTLQTVPAEPVTIARMFSLKESDLVVKKRRR